MHWKRFLPAAKRFPRKTFRYPRWNGGAASAKIRLPLGGRLTVRLQTLDLRIGVRIPASQPTGCCALAQNHSLTVVARFRAGPEGTPSASGFAVALKSSSLARVDRPVGYHQHPVGWEAGIRTPMRRSSLD